MKTPRAKVVVRLALFLLAGGFGLAPTVVEALPRHCDAVCSCGGSCNWKCNASEGGIAITTCGEWGICAGNCRGGQPQAEGPQALFLDESEAQAGEGCDARQQSSRADDFFAALPTE